jgi:Fic family protein
VAATPKRTTGIYLTSSVAGESVKTFVPNPLPPRPPLELGQEHLDLLEKANRALGRLDGVARLLPDTALFVYFYVRKEAVLSSQIEGTQSTLADLLLYESKQEPGVPLEDVEEVSTYVAALNHGLKRVRNGFPLSLRLIREIHAILLRSGRGRSKQPGEFRRSQDWIGGTRPGNAKFVPPPPNRLLDCMSALEKFLHGEPEPTPALIKAALAHVQFETIHPFLDGNGRVGRLLITLLLCVEGALAEPVLYLSLYLKRNRAAYYEALDRVRTDGEWEAWLRFFLSGVVEAADEAAAAALRIAALFQQDSEKVAELGRAAGNALKLFGLLQRKPIVSIADAAAKLKISFPTASSAMANLQGLKIVREITGASRGKLFVYDRYLKFLQEGTEPIR